METIIEIKNLSKAFGEVKAVRDLSFCVKRGELFAFLGVNGAGKSTTISIMCGSLKKDGGSVTICGRQSGEGNGEIAAKLGVVFQNSVLDKALSVKDNLESRAALYGISGNSFKKRLSELSKMLDFENLLGRTVGKLSGGQRRRIDVARALLHKPEILILDEPTTGLDPQTRKLLWNTVKTLREKENMTVFLTTHYMEETADCDNVVIIDSGKISANDTPHNLKKQYAHNRLVWYTPKSDGTENLLKAEKLDFEYIGDAYKIKIADSSQATRLITSYPQISDYEVIKGDMDDVFLTITGKRLGE